MAKYNNMIKCKDIIVLYILCFSSCFFLLKGLNEMRVSSFCYAAFGILLVLPVIYFVLNLFYSDQLEDTLLI